MNKYILTFFTNFYFVISFINSSAAQQFSIKKLIPMAAYSKLFEKEMVKIGNYPISIDKYSTYEYKEKESGTVFVELEEYFKMNSDMETVTKKMYSQATFAENYDATDETASTFYYLTTLKSIPIKGKLIPPAPENDGCTLKIEFVRRSDYQKILQELNTIATYLRTRTNLAGDIESIYKMGIYYIYTEKSSNRDYGGHVKISTKYLK